MQGKIHNYKFQVIKSKTKQKKKTTGQKIY